MQHPMLCELSAGGIAASPQLQGSRKRREFIVLRSGVMAGRSAQQEEPAT